MPDKVLESDREKIDDDELQLVNAYSGWQSGRKLNFVRELVMIW